MSGRVSAVLFVLLFVSCEAKREAAPSPPPPPPPAGPPSIVFDCYGRTIAVRVGNEVFATSSEFAPIVGTIGPVTTPLTVTLDADLQRLAVRALGANRGSLVAIDPRTNEILAVANTATENLAFDKQYEPGSVIKVLTVLAALGGGVNVDSLFPYTCDGALPIDGRRFGDWRPGGHGLLPDLDEALAQSCNVVFADIGLRAGAERLEALHQRVGFDGQTNLGLFRVPLGRKVGKLFNDFETAFYAIGLEHETVTTLHLAMLASMLANRGTLVAPRLVPAPGPRRGQQVVPREHAERVIRAMQAVVARPKGTGRRAAIEGLSIAMKTGTSGTRDGGYDALVMAFAPVEQPRVAFAVILENAGPAELAAAQVARDFLEAVGHEGTGGTRARGF